MRHLGFLKLAFAGVVLVAVVSSGLALGANPFVDVPAAKFYADPVDWAYNNALTTGSPAGSNTFKPEDPVTRGENITFNYRYDQNIVQPELADRLTVDDMMGMWDHASDVPHSQTSLTDTAISGAEVTVTIPEGHTGYVDLRFTGESVCYGGTGTLILIFFLGPWCEIKFYDAGGEIFGDGAAFDSVDKDTNGDTVGDETSDSWESHAATYVHGPLNAGTYTFKAYGGSNGTAPPTFNVGDWTFTAQVHLAS